MSKRAVTYARVSGNDRAKTGGENLQHQLKLCREYAESKGYVVVTELAEDDRGASGATFDLPELSQALDMAAKGEYDVLVVRELDRLSRDLTKQLLIEQELKRVNVAIEYVLYDFPDTPEGRLNKNFRAMLAEYEREKIKQRMVRGARRKAENGAIVMNGGKPPYGYEISEDGQFLVPNEKEAPVVKMIFEWYTRGKDGQRLSTIKIAEYLSELKIPTWADTHDSGLNVNRKRPPCTWSPASVGHILHSRVYKGIWEYGKADTDGAPNPENHKIAVEVPALVDAETWEAAQKQATHNMVIGPRNTKNRYLMQHRMHCAICGRKIGALTTRDRGKAYPYYACYGRMNSNVSAREKCPLKWFRADHVDEAVWQWIVKLLRNPEALTTGLEDRKREQEEANRPLCDRLQLVNKMIADYTAQLEKVLDLYLTGDFTREMLTERRARIETTLEGLRQKQSSLEERLAAQVIDDEQIQTIQAFVQKIRGKLLQAEADFASKKYLVELLQVDATLAVEDGVKIAYVSCILGDETLLIDSSAPKRDTI